LEILPALKSFETPSLKYRPPPSLSFSSDALLVAEFHELAEFLESPLRDILVFFSLEGT